MRNNINTDCIPAAETPAKRTTLDIHSDPLAFPRLNECEQEKAAAFGEPCSFKEGEALVSAGQHPFQSYLILSGTVRVVDVSCGERTVFIRYGAGYFTGDIDLFTGRPSVVTCEAETPVTAVRLAPDRLREMFIRNPALGERFWVSFQRRRRLLLASSFRGVSVYGSKHDKLTLDTIELLFRNGVPHHWANTDLADTRAALRRIKEDVSRFPVVTHGNTVLFEAPGRVQLADYIGLRRTPPTKVFDVLVIGAGPSGLGAAVYAASEGLSTLILDGTGPGGQAGASSRIENYAGFPNGISGGELAQRAYLQALKFGAELLAPGNVTRLARRDDGIYEVQTAEGDRVTGRSVVIATGVSYGLLDVNGLDTLRGAGIYYNATKVEALLCAREPVHVIGAGNSAGQAAMFLCQSARGVSMIVRGSSIREKMSAYLSQRILANDKIKIHYRTKVAGVEGAEHIDAVTLRHDDGRHIREATAGLFIFIGATPRTDFLPPSVARDGKGFILTGAAVADSWHGKEDRAPCALETSLPGVFACGDCRSGTTKRVAFAIGDGAMAVTCVHEFLSAVPQAR